MNGFISHLRIVFTPFCCCMCLTAIAEENTPDMNTELNAGVEFFRWQEFDSTGTRLLTESGPRLFVSGTANSGIDNPDSRFFAEAVVSGYAGNVDYDGQDTNNIFTSSISEYSGYILEVYGGYRLNGMIDMDIIAGTGINSWTREIRDENNAEGDLVTGIKEDYMVQYYTLALGLPQRYATANGYLKIGLKRPFNTSEDVDQFNVKLSPGKELSGFINYKLTFNANARRRKLISSIMFYYDSFRLSRSKAKVSVINGNTVQVRQPESNLDVMGIAIGHVF